MTNRDKITCSVGAPSQIEGGTGGQNIEAKKYTTTEKNWQHRAEHGMGIGSEFIDAGRTMVITIIGEPYRDGKQRLIDAWAVEKQPGALTLSDSPIKDSSGKRGRFKEFVRNKRDAEGEK